MSGGDFYASSVAACAAPDTPLPCEVLHALYNQLPNEDHGRAASASFSQRKLRNAATEPCLILPASDTLISLVVAQLLLVCNTQRMAHALHIKYQHIKTQDVYESISTVSLRVRLKM